MSALPLSTSAADWRADAACRDVDLELFFASDESSQQEAMAICEACPVRTPCLEHAIQQREPYGIWGGTREHERRRLARARSRDAA